MVTVVTSDRTYTYQSGTSASTDSRGHLTVYGVDGDALAGFAPGAWTRYRTVDEEEKGSEPLVG